MGYSDASSTLRAIPLALQQLRMRKICVQKREPWRTERKNGLEEHCGVVLSSSRFGSLYLRASKNLLLRRHSGLTLLFQVLGKRCFQLVFLQEQHKCFECTLELGHSLLLVIINEHIFTEGVSLCVKGWKYQGCVHQSIAFQELKNMEHKIPL